MTSKITDYLQKRIETIIHDRLEDSVTLVEVLNWLNNFEGHHINSALDILEKLEYFSIPRIVTTYHYHLRHIFLNFPQKKIVFLAIGAFGKSGTAMSYFIKQAPCYTDGRYKKIKFLASSQTELAKIVAENKIDPEDFLLILMDDFIGSGKSTSGYINGDEHSKGLRSYLNANSLRPKMAVLALVVLNVGKNHLSKETPDVFVAAELRIKVFAANNSIFGYRPKMLPLRELAYNKGSSLVRDPRGSLGFDNSQGLVAFAHTTPNNTIPIIWSDKNNWQPLYPRFGSGKIEKLKKLREESSYWLSLAVKNRVSVFTGIGAGIYSVINLQLITIMRLKAVKRTVPIICQIMGVTVHEYNDILNEGFQRGLFKKNGMISSRGQSLYDELSKAGLIKKGRQKRLLDDQDEIIYLPSTFRGET